MATIIEEEKIKSLVQKLDVVAAMQEGFIQYSNGNSVVPPVGELIFEEPKGEAHIKYGYIKGDDFYCIKIASGFYGNPALGISSSQGLMLLFNQKTGELVSVLLDGGFLTDIRTAGAGALATKFFAPKELEGVGILGTGIQGRLQLQFMQKNNPCKKVWIWDIAKESAEKYKEELSAQFDIQIADSPAEVARNCNLIYTTTPSKIPLLQANDVRPGTHINAVGSDTEEKQELQSEILAKADIVISDAIPQSKSRGEVFRATSDHVITHEKVVELGRAIQDQSLQRTDENQISVVDLTGVAVQDIMIAKATYLAYTSKA